MNARRNNLDGLGLAELRRELADLHALLADPVNYATLVTTELIGGIPIVAPQAAVGGKPQVQITLQAGGSNTDGNFSVAVFGE